MRKAVALRALAWCAILAGGIAAQDPPLVGFDKLVEYVRIGVPEDRLLKLVAASPTKFVLSAEQAGQLRAAGATESLMAGLAAKPAAPTDIADFVIIMDFSASMNEKAVGGAGTKLQATKTAVWELLDAIPDGKNVAFIVYGHDKARRCKSIDVLRRLGPFDQGIRAAIRQRLEPLPGAGNTPIAASLNQAAALLAGRAARSSVILVTDGVESCRGDPVAAAAALLAATKGQSSVNVIGIGLKEDERQAVSKIAEAGKGRFFDARTVAELKTSFAKVRKEVVQSPPTPAPTPTPAPVPPKRPAPAPGAKVAETPAPAPTPKGEVVPGTPPVPTPAPGAKVAEMPAPAPTPKVEVAPVAPKVPAPGPGAKVAETPAPAPTPKPDVAPVSPKAPAPAPGAKVAEMPAPAPSAKGDVAPVTPPVPAPDAKVPPVVPGAPRDPSVAAAELIRGLADADRKVRSQAAAALGLLGADALPAVPALAALVKDNRWDPETTAQDDPAKEAALQALQDLKAPVEEALSGAAAAKDYEVRQWAARRLGDFHPPADGGVRLKTLLRLLEDPHRGVRAAAAGAFRELGELGRPALPTLLKLIQDERWDPDTEAQDDPAKEAALRSAKAFARDQAQAALVAAGKSPTPEVRAWATRQLGEFDK